MTTFETEFDARLSAFDGDARRCAIFGYTHFAIDFVAGSDADILDRLREHSPFWSAVQAALQAAAVISLGRVFDDRKGSRSADALLAFAEAHPRIFSPAALEARRLNQPVTTHGWHEQ